jgi:hypothetical protein
MNAIFSRASICSSCRPIVALWFALVVVRALAAGGADDASKPATGATGTADPAAVSSRGADPEVGTVERGDRVRFTNQATDIYYNQSKQLAPEYFFFPPDPPQLGTAIRLFYPAPTGIPAPPELAAYVNEPFYPVLGVRLADEDLPRRLQLGLETYRAAKVELQNELRARIARLAEADAATRRQELAALARIQTPRIAELETTAAQLRTEFQRSGVYGVLAGRGDWNERRTWRLASKRSDKAPKDTLQMEFEVLRAAVFFQAGLSPAQRRLVREVSMELQAEIRQTDEPPPKGVHNAGFFFSPETARISVPTDLPAPLAGQIAEFVAEKTQLKAELREALRNYDEAEAGQRERALRELAASQAPRIADFEERAEKIRQGLAGVPDMPGPPAPPRLPDELAARISAYRSHKAELLQVLRAELAPALLTDRYRAKTAALREQVAAFNREHAAQFAQLTAEKDGVREALARYVRSGDSVRDRKSIDDLLEEFENSRQEREVWDHYRDYQTAVLLPGLSPEQRRLLFDAALENLAVPLPAGEAGP